MNISILLDKVISDICQPIDSSQNISDIHSKSFTALRKLFDEIDVRYPGLILYSSAPFWSRSVGNGDDGQWLRNVPIWVNRKHNDATWLKLLFSSLYAGWPCGHNLTSDVCHNRPSIPDAIVFASDSFAVDECLPFNHGMVESIFFPGTSVSDQLDKLHIDIQTLNIPPFGEVISYGSMASAVQYLQKQSLGHKPAFVDGLPGLAAWYATIGSQQGLRAVVFMPARIESVHGLERSPGGVVLALGSTSIKSVELREIFSLLWIVNNSLLARTYGVDSKKHALLKAKRAAIAAIMSRNLSHNVGSHSLANSRLFESIGILQEVDSVSGDDKTDGGEFRLGKATHPLKSGEVWRARQRLATFNSFIQGRLDFIARALGETSSSPEPMFFVNDLLRGFFSQRVLLNTLLSDNGITIKDIEFHVLIPSNSTSNDNVLPVVYIGKCESNDHELRHVLFVLSKEGGALGLRAAQAERDALIAIPGGMIGRHAFYAFLENVMRNAAKYGRKRKIDGVTEPMIIQIALRHGHAVVRGTDATGRTYKPCYWIDVTDNRSVDPAVREQDESKRAKSVSLQVRRCLNDPIITPDGRPQTAGHGIQEMKVCAEFLAGNDLCFPPDDECMATQWQELNGGCVYCASILQAKILYQTPDKEKRTAWIKEENALQAFVTPSGFEIEETTTEPIPASVETPLLTYRLIAQKPVIMGIVNIGGGAIDNDNPAVCYHSSIEALAVRPAHFGLIVVKDTEKSTMQKVLREVAILHDALPFRLMIVTQNDTLREQWKKEIENLCAGPNKPYVRVKESDNGDKVPVGGIPTRRVYAVSCPSLFDEGTKLKPVPDFANDGYGLFTEVYEAWLRAWKGHELKQFNAHCWHVWIGFDRAAGEGHGSPIINKWIGLNTFNSDLVKVRIKTTGNDEKTNYGENAQGLLESKKNLIVFDNHGKVFGNAGEGGDGSVVEPAGLLSAPACYHSFSGAGQIDLFHSLETPPNDRFGFAFLLYNVVETALLSIAVVDERVGEAMIAEEMLFGNKHRKLQMARVYPLFQVQFANTEEMARSSYLLSPEIGNAINKVVDVLERRGDGRWCYSGNRSDIKKEEGLLIDKGIGIGRVNPLVLCEGEYTDDTPSLMFLSQADSLRSCLVDTVVMHEGIVDSIRDAWTAEQPDPFYAIVPFFVRTSGRGAVSRHHGDHLPFLEFSELSDSTYQSQNKLSLGRSLLGLRGYPKKDS